MAGLVIVDSDFEKGKFAKSVAALKAHQVEGESEGAPNPFTPVAIEGCAAIKEQKPDLVFAPLLGPFWHDIT